MGGGGVPAPLILCPSFFLVLCCFFWFFIPRPPPPLPLPPPSKSFIFVGWRVFFFFSFLSAWHQCERYPSPQHHFFFVVGVFFFSYSLRSVLRFCDRLFVRRCNCGRIRPRRRSKRRRRKTVNRRKKVGRGVVQRAKGRLGTERKRCFFFFFFFFFVVVVVFFLFCFSSLGVFAARHFSFHFLFFPAQWVFFFCIVKFCFRSPPQNSFSFCAPSLLSSSHERGRLGGVSASTSPCGPCPSSAGPGCSACWSNQTDQRRTATTEPSPGSAATRGLPTASAPPPPRAGPRTTSPSPPCAPQRDRRSGGQRCGATQSRLP
eukprot:Rhum_TRINITY_DN11193_c0_g10::Rhum_TRINITY_DN11193_c0_g10_i1::g.43145::m.43145